MTLILAVVNSPQTVTMNQIEKHYRENASRLIAKYSHFLKSKERAEDVVQEAYARVCLYWSDAPSDPTEFARWWSGVFSNAIKDNHREEILKGATNDREKEEDGIEGPAIPAIIYRQVVQRINAKPDNQARILSMALLQQQRPSDIAAQVPESAVTIRKIISRFRKELKQEFNYNL